MKWGACKRWDVSNLDGLRLMRSLKITLCLNSIMIGHSCQIKTPNLTRLGAPTSTASCSTNTLWRTFSPPPDLVLLMHLMPTHFRFWKCSSLTLSLSHAPHFASFCCSAPSLEVAHTDCIFLMFWSQSTHYHIIMCVTVSCKDSI